MLLCLKHDGRRSTINVYFYDWFPLTFVKLVGCVFGGQEYMDPRQNGWEFSNYSPREAINRLKLDPIYP